MNITAILGIIQLLAGTATKLTTAPGVQQDVTIGTDLLQVAQMALQLHSQATGLPMDSVLKNLHDLPPLPSA